MEMNDTLKGLYAFKIKDLQGIQERMLNAVSQMDAHENLKELLKQEVSHSGKMIRPLLELLAAGNYPEEAREELLCAAAAAELLHISSLFHDDIIDDAKVRRGYPSVQARYGIPIAICAGDFLMLTPFSYLSSRGYHETAGELMDAALKVCAGELLQDEHQFDISVDEKIYFSSIRGKTAASFAACCGIGCRISGKSVQLQQSMRSFGETLGMMFQIRDDLLDWTKDKGFLGKPANEDFVNGIYTLPVIYAFRQDSYGKELSKFTKGGFLTESDISEVREIVIKSGGIKYAKSIIDNFAQKAFELLSLLPKDIYYNYLCNLVEILQNDL